jgi:hypothetical protein
MNPNIAGTPRALPVSDKTSTRPRTRTKIFGKKIRISNGFPRMQNPTKIDCENSNDYTINSILTNVEKCKKAPEFMRTSNSCKLKNNIIYCGDGSVNISSVVSFSLTTKRLICSQ